MAFDFYQIGALRDFPSRVRVEQENMTIRDCLKYLGERYHRDLEAELLDEQGQLQAGYLLLLDGRSIGSEKGLEAVIPDNGVLLLTVLIAGG